MKEGTGRSYLNQITGRLVFNFKPINDSYPYSLDLTNLSTWINPRPFQRGSLSPTPNGSCQFLQHNQARTVLTEGRSEALAITGQLLADYSKTFKGGHSIGVLGGYEELYNSSESLGASRSGFALTDFPYLNAGSQELRDNSGSASESALRSFFGRVKYDLNNKYYIQGNLRYDKSSRFWQAVQGCALPFCVGPVGSFQKNHS